MTIFGLSTIGLFPHQWNFKDMLNSILHGLQHSLVATSQAASSAPTMLFLVLLRMQTIGREHCTDLSECSLNWAFRCHPYSWHVFSQVHTSLDNRV